MEFTRKSIELRRKFADSQAGRGSGWPAPSAANRPGFIREMDFAGGHAFTYSPRPGTGASRLGGQIRHAVRKERNAILREVFEAGARAYRERFIGRKVSVLWESATEYNGDGWLMAGLTENYLRVKAVARRPLWNEISTVRVQGLDSNGLKAVI